MAWTAQALRQGMTAYDALFYHGPMAARFAQTANLTRLHLIVPGEAVTFYPATTEMWHAVGMVAFRTDIASPVANLAALAVAILAAWCLGRRWGGAPAAVAGVALVSSMPYITASQPGSSFNDAPALAALLAALALLSRADESEGAGLLGALAAGLAIGIKLSFVAPALAVALACWWLLPRARRAFAWLGAIVVAGGYWYARNLIRVGNPLPGVNVGLPAPSFPVDARYGTPLLASLDLSAHGWRSLYHPGLQEYFGRVWPGMVALVVVALIVGLSQRARWHRWVAIAMAVTIVAYTVTPVTGDPAFFRFNLRYTLPIQALAVVLLATHPRLVGRWAQRAMVALALATVALAWPAPAPGSDPLQVGGWPVGSGHRLAAVAVTLAVGAGLVAGWGLWRVTRRAWVVVGVAAVASVTAIAAGRGVATRYERTRYRDVAAQLGPAWAWAQGVSHSRIAVVGLYQQYPFTGAHVDNMVQYVGVRTPHGGLARAPSCRVWRAAIDAGRYQYVVTSREGLVFDGPGEPPEAGWTRRDPSAHEVLHVGDTAVFRLSAPLNPDLC
jgi:hypothetical protein